jgi:hypothetical protein
MRFDERARRLSRIRIHATAAMKSFIKSTLLVLLLSIIVGCAESKIEKARQAAQTLPFEEQGAFYVSLVKGGKLTKEEGFETLYFPWYLEKERREKEAKLLATMTPGEREIYFQNQKILKQQADLAAGQRDLRAQQALISISVSQQQNQLYNQQVQAQDARISQGFQNLQMQPVHYTPPQFQNPYSR